MKDGPYLLVVLFLVSIVLSVIFWVAWKTLGRPRHARTWSLAFAIGAGGYLLNAVGAVFRLTSPGYVMLISLPTLIISYLGTRGYRQRAGLPACPVRFGAGFLLTVGVMAVCNFIVPHYGIRVAVVPFFGAIMLLLAADAAVRHERRPSAADRAAAIFQIVFACFEVALTAMSLRIGKGPNLPAVMLYNEVLLLGLPSCYIANGLMAMFVLASDLARRMELLAETDTLTGLLNRRGFEREAVDAIALAHANGSALAAVLADLDHFKRINDRHGHGIGDLALSRFSDYLRATLPGFTPIGRLGGEEFVFLVASTPEAGVVDLVDHVRRGVTGVSLAEFEVEPFTASFGITFLELDDAGLVDLLARADVALYHAKASGRNRACRFDPSLRPLHVPRVQRRAEA
jgi:diguanylate cyclase (GGDEF)-like protein